MLSKHMRRLKGRLSCRRNKQQGRCERSLTSFLVSTATNKAGPAVFNGDHQAEDTVSVGDQMKHVWDEIWTKTAEKKSSV